MTALSVNINKIAVLRNSRGGNLPCVQEAARVCVAAGCHGITVHPRPDQRHICAQDIYKLNAWLPVELNIEGNPFSSSLPNGYPGFMNLIERIKPAQCTLVPDSDDQITSNHGFNMRHDAERLKPIVEQLKQWGCRVSVFMDADGVTGGDISVQENIQLAAQIGVNRIEIYTGPYASAYAQKSTQPEQFEQSLQQCMDIAQYAKHTGLGVNAGHDLNQANLPCFLQKISSVLEVSIGHALISEAIYDGLFETVQRYLQVVQ